jgi:hypothetical protein
MCFPGVDHLPSTRYRHPSGIGAKEFLSMEQYKHANRWADELMKRPQVQRGQCQHFVL